VTPNEYQDACRETAIYPGKDDFDLSGLYYTVLGLNGEAGEVAELVKKRIRDGVLDRDRLKKEAGDVAWYLAMFCFEAGFTLEEVMAANLEKLAQRKAAGTLRGSGSDR
jgi:NTP pyrophosphatase (non-canonical NTP hydrolase)